ncbi:MAG: hypothetical protein JWQ63_1819 [Mucilaginibacter sp.]|nr:hypothetical protein [Mucilaginibacter sp.]
MKFILAYAQPKILTIAAIKNTTNQNKKVTLTSLLTNEESFIHTLLIVFITKIRYIINHNINNQVFNFLVKNLCFLQVVNHFIDK